MADFMLVQVFDCTEHFAHVIDSSPFTKPLTLYNFFEKLTSCGKFHDNVNVPQIDVAFMKLDNIWVADLLQYL